MSSGCRFVRIGTDGPYSPGPSITTCSRSSSRLMISLIETYVQGRRSASLAYVSIKDTLKGSK